SSAVATFISILWGNPPGFGTISAQKPRSSGLQTDDLQRHPDPIECDILVTLLFFLSFHHLRAAWCVALLRGDGRFRSEVIMGKMNLSGPGAGLAAAMPAVPALADVSVKISGRVGFVGGAVISSSRDGQLDRDYDFLTGARLQFDIKNVTD